MVKRALAVILITLLMLVFATFEVISVSNLINNIKNDVQQINDEFPQTETNIDFLLPQVTQLRDYWKDNENALCIIFNHKDLSLITDSINKFYSYIELNNYEEAEVEFNVLKMQVEKSNHVMGFNLQNIF